MTAGANGSANPCLDGLKILYVTIAEVHLITAATLTPANVSADNRTKHQWRAAVGPLSAPCLAAQPGDMQMSSDTRQVGD